MSSDSDPGDVLELMVDDYDLELIEEVQVVKDVPKIKEPDTKQISKVQEIPKTKGPEKKVANNRIPKFKIPRREVVNKPEVQMEIFPLFRQTKKPETITEVSKTKEVPKTKDLVMVEVPKKPEVPEVKKPKAKKRKTKEVIIATPLTEDTRKTVVPMVAEPIILNLTSSRSVTMTMTGVTEKNKELLKNPYPGGKPAAFAAMVQHDLPPDCDNRAKSRSPCSSVSSIPSIKQSSSIAGDPVAKKAKNPAAKKKGGSSQSGKRRTKPTSNKIATHVDQKSESNQGQVGPEEYVVEKICGKKYSEGVAYYHIKWKGWAHQHNTWEPVENLDGCPGILDKFESELVKKNAARKQGGKKKEAGGYESECGSSIRDDESVVDISPYHPTDEMKKCRNEIVEFGIAKEWPTDRIPVEMIGVWTIDERLSYLIRCQHYATDSLETPPLTGENVVVVHASAFRRKFPHLVIKFYEARMAWREQKPAENVEQAIAPLMSQSQHVEESENKDNVTNEPEKIQSVVPSCSVVAGPSSANANNDDEKMEVDSKEDEDDDDDEDDEDVQKIFIRKGADLFGLPTDLSSSEASSDEDFVQCKPPYMFKS